MTEELKEIGIAGYRVEKDEEQRFHSVFHLRLRQSIRAVGACHSRKSAKGEGRFAIGFKVAVKDGVPAKLKVTSRISTTITDEIESTVDDPNQPTLL